MAEEGLAGTGQRLGPATVIFLLGEDLQLHRVAQPMGELTFTDLPSPCTTQIRRQSPILPLPQTSSSISPAT